MKRAFLGDAHPLTKLIFTGFSMAGIMLVILLLGGLVAIPVFGLGIGSLVELDLDPDEPGQIAILRYFQVLYTIGLFILPAFLVSWFFTRSWTAYLSVDRNALWGSYILGTLLIFITLPLINFLGEINANLNLPGFLSGVEDYMKKTEDYGNKLMEKFLETGKLSGLALNIFMVAIIPAIGEELIFRGVIQRIFIEWFRNIHWAIIGSAILFSALHMQFYGFLPRFFLGAFFGYLMVWSGSIWLPVLVHFMNNTAGVLAYYFLDTGKAASTMDEIGTTQHSWYTVFISLALFILIMYRIRKLEKSGKDQPVS